MKKLVLVLSFMLLALAAVFAQAPQRMSYQAVVRDANNALVTNHAVTARITILQGGIGGTPVYVENHSVMTNSNGLMTLEVGNGAAVSGSMESINWGNGPFYLKSEIDPEGGISYTVEGVQELLSVPYALYAARADNVPAFAVTPTDTGYVFVLTMGDGTTQTYVVRNGQDGQAGATGPAGPQGPPGATGPQGAAGKGISSITGPVSVGLQDTYTIHYTDNTTSTFTVVNGAQGPQGPAGAAGATGATGPQGPAGPQGPQGPTGNNGRGIANIMGPVMNDQQGTYTIVYTDGTTSTFTVTNGANGQDGRGIIAITGPATNGLQDTYTLTYTDGTTSTFTVTNGAAGATGPQGPAGPTGPQGETGPQGPEGPAGPQGPAGVGVAQTLTINGNQLTITGGNTITLPTGGSGGGNDGRGIQNITGPVTSGLEDTYTIHFTDGTTTTFVVTNGAAGATGAQGPQGEQGPAGPQGEPGVAGATGPRGPQGDPGAAGATGPQGDPGPAGVGIASITGPTGSGL